MSDASDWKVSLLLLGLLTLAAALAGVALVGLVFVGSAAFGDEIVRSPVVKITDEDGHGSGFYIGQIDGRDLYITAAHVAEDAILHHDGKFTIDFADGAHSGVLLDAKSGQPVLDREGNQVWGNRVLVWDSLYDFAIIESMNAIRPPQPLSINCGPILQPGTMIAALGYPLGFPELRTTGTVASRLTAWMPDWAEIVMLDLTILPGNSGGPVIGPDGRVAGVMVGWLAPTGLSAMIPMRRICNWLDIQPDP